MAGHAQLKFVMTECSKTQIRLAGLTYINNEMKTKRQILHKKKIKIESMISSKKLPVLHVNFDLQLLTRSQVHS